MPKTRFPFRNRYGRFADDGNSFIVSRPDTPGPWVNVLSTGSYGVVMSQSGAGYSWMDRADRGRITRWSPDPLRDDWGRHIYLRDDKTGKVWSAGWNPVRARPDTYECVHGVGYTVITSRSQGIQSQWLVFVPHDEPLEIWRLRVRNLSKQTRRISLWTYIEWAQTSGNAEGRAASFHQGNRVLTTKQPSSGRRPAGWVAWHGASLPVKEACADRGSFIGPNGSPQAPEALLRGRYLGKPSRRDAGDISSLCLPLTLKPGEERSMLFTVGAAESEEEALAKARQFQDFSEVDHAWHRTEMFWDKYLSAFPVQTPDPAFNMLTNTWLKYQALSSFRWGRAEESSACRGQLQDSLALLPLDPDQTREQIRLYAAHQRPDGSAPCEGPAHDDPLWLPLAITQYLKETGQWSFLSENVLFASRPGEGKASSASLYEHASRVIDRALENLSPRGLPLVGGGAAGNGWQGENVSRGHFLYGALTNWSAAVERAVQKGALSSREKSRAARYRGEAAKLKRSLNRHAWDGQWFFGATWDDGTVQGSRKNKEGQIFLSAQTWALLNDVVDVPARRTAILKAVQKLLYGPHGAHPVYPPKADHMPAGEGGGLPLYASILALQMETSLGRTAQAWELYRSLCPVLRDAQDPKTQQQEPYVIYGNGSSAREEWKWPTGAAAWLYRASTEGILGIRPDWDGLRLKPCLPSEWDKAGAVRVFRGGTYRIRFFRDAKLKPGAVTILFNGRKLAGDLLPVSPDRANEVLVAVGRAS